MDRFTFDMEMRRIRQDTQRKLAAAAASKDPDTVRLAAFVFEVIASPPRRDWNDEHRLTADQLGIARFNKDR